MRKITFFSLFIILILAISYIVLNNSIGNQTQLAFLKNLLSSDQKKIIKNYFFSNNVIQNKNLKIEELEEKLDNLYSDLDYFESLFASSGDNITLQKTDELQLKNSYKLFKYKILNGFYSGQNNRYPGSGYIDFNLNDLFLISSKGVLAYSKNYDHKKNNEFIQIKNNISNYISIKQYNKHIAISLKDLHISNDQIFISFIEEINKDCWNTSVLYSNINYQEIYFKKLFSSTECIHSKDNVDKVFNPQSSGGRIERINNEYILLTVGEYKSRFLAQDSKSINGKILKINIYDSSYEIISMGHRNPQGLVFDVENDFILETEHGPQGGDEINIVKLDLTNEKEVSNYGWPISSYGEHYGGKNAEKNKLKYEKYPLHKSHDDYNFIEPLHYFVPSIGISQIVKIRKNYYSIASMVDESIYFFRLDKFGKLVDLQRIEVFERIRDLVYKNKKLYLFLEDSASIGVIELNI